MHNFIKNQLGILIYIRYLGKMRAITQREDERGWVREDQATERLGEPEWGPGPGKESTCRQKLSVSGCPWPSHSRRIRGEEPFESQRLAASSGVLPDAPLQYCGECEDLYGVYPRTVARFGGRQQNCASWNSGTQQWAPTPAPRAKDPPQGNLVRREGVRGYVW